MSGSVTSVRKPRLPKFTPRIGMPEPASPMRSAMPRSVPSPPRTSTRSTSSTSARLSATLRPGAGGMSAAVAVSKTAVTPRASSQAEISSRCGAAARKWDLATIPTRDTGASGWVEVIGLSSIVAQVLGSLGLPCAKMQKKLLVAGRAGDWRGRHAQALQPDGLGRLGDPRDHRLVHRRIGDQTAPPDLLAPGLELGFDERHDVGPRGEKRRGRPQNEAQRDERDVDGHDVDLVRYIRARERSGIDALADDDARVGAQAPIELTVADVERDDAGGSSLQQHVGEAAGRGADIEGAAAGGIHGEGLERVRELDAAAADVRMVGHGELDAGIRGGGRAGLRDDLAVYPHLAGEDERTGAFTRRRQPAIEDKCVETGCFRQTRQQDFTARVEMAN